MAIKVACECGKLLSVPDEAAGRRARCPECAAVVQVPGTPPPSPSPEPDEPPATKFDEVVDSFQEHLARSRERAPELTQVAMALLIWTGVSLALSFIGSLFVGESGSLVLWLVIYVPMSVVGALLALGTIKAWHRTPECMEPIALILVGINYALFWQWATKVAGWGAIFFVISVVNLGGYVFLYLYFRRSQVKVLFVPETEAAETPGQETQPSKGVDKK